MYKFLILSLIFINFCQLNAKDTCKLNLKSSISLGFMPKSLLNLSKNYNKPNEFFFNYSINRKLPNIYLGFAYQNTKEKQVNSSWTDPVRVGFFSSRTTLVGLSYLIWKYKKISSSIGVFYIKHSQYNIQTIYDPKPYTSFRKENSDHIASSLQLEYSPICKLDIGLGIRGLFYSKVRTKVINNSFWPIYDENDKNTRLNIINFRDFNSGLKIMYLTIKYTV